MDSSNSDFEDGLPPAEEPSKPASSAPVHVEGEAVNPLAEMGRPHTAKSTVTPYMRGLEPWPSGPYKGQYRKVVQD